MGTLSDLRERFRELAGNDSELRTAARRAALDEWRALQEEMDELIPAIRRRAWEADQAERAELGEEQRQSLAAQKETKELRYLATSALVQARKAGDSSAVKLAAEIEGHKAAEKEIAERLDEIGRKLGRLPGSGEFRGTTRELADKLMDPDFLVDRDWVRAKLLGGWRHKTEEVYIRFRLDNGAVVQSSS